MAYSNHNKNTKSKYPWMGQVIVHGKKKRKLCKTKREAEQWEVEKRQEILEKQSAPRRESTTVTLYEWAERYLNFAEKKFVHKTFQEKRKAFRQLFQCEEINPHSPVVLLESLAVLDHLQTQAEERSGNAANKDRKNLAAAWKWGVKYLHLPVMSPISAVDRFAETRSVRHVPTLADFWAVYDKAQTEQDRLMLFTYLQTGARREELFRLRWSDVDFFNSRVRLYWRKNKAGEWKHAWLPAKSQLMDWLKVHQNVTGKAEFVFLNRQGSDSPKYWIPYQYRQHWLKDLCSESGVTIFGFHGIRHLFASILAAQNIPLVEIQFMLRHSNLTTTQRYIHRLKKESREVVKALPDLEERLKESTLKVHLKENRHSAKSAKCL